MPPPSRRRSRRSAVGSRRWGPVSRPAELPPSLLRLLRRRAGLTVGRVLFAMGGPVAFFRSFSEVASQGTAAGTRLRPGGLVREGSLRRGPDHHKAFAVIDAAAKTQVVTKACCPTCSAKARAWWRRACCSPTVHSRRYGPCGPDLTLGTRSKGLLTPLYESWECPLLGSLMSQVRQLLADCTLSASRHRRG